MTPDELQAKLATDEAQVDADVAALDAIAPVEPQVPDPLPDAPDAQVAIDLTQSVLFPQS